MIFLLFIILNIAGYYCPTNTSYPIPCPTMNYCPTGSAQPITCDNILGNYCGATFRGSQICDATYYCPNVTAMIPCPNNFYCPVGSSSPIPCFGSSFPSGMFCAPQVDRPLSCM